MAMVAAAIAAAAAGSPATAAPPVGPDRRLLLGFVEDGAIVGRGWFEASFRAADHGDGEDYEGFLLAALRYGRDVEAGVIAGALHRGRDAGAPLYGGHVGEAFSETGLPDVLVYGKYRVLRGAVDLSLGASARLPIAGDATGLSSGALEVRGFVGARGALPGGTALVGHFGFVTAGTSGYSGASGGTALRAGIGVLVPLERIWTLILEVDHEGAVFDGDDAGTTGLAGVAWQPTESIVVRGGVGGGSGRAADVAGHLGVAFYF
jgi:hypothetical protein